MRKGRVRAQAVSRRLPTAAARIEPRSGHVGFVVDKVALGHVFPEYFGFFCQFSFHLLFHIHHLSSGAGTISQLQDDVPSGLSLILLFYYISASCCIQTLFNSIITVFNATFCTQSHTSTLLIHHTSYIIQPQEKYMKFRRSGRSDKKSFGKTYGKNCMTDLLNISTE
jgi:hypothetical protein